MAVTNLHRWVVQNTTYEKGVRGLYDCLAYADARLIMLAACQLYVQQSITTDQFLAHISAAIAANKANVKALGEILSKKKLRYAPALECLWVDGITTLSDMDRQRQSTKRERGMVVRNIILSHPNTNLLLEKLKKFQNQDGLSQALFLAMATARSDEDHLDMLEILKTLNGVAEAKWFSEQVKSYLKGKKVDSLYKHFGHLVDLYGKTAMRSVLNSYPNPTVASRSLEDFLDR